MSLTPKVFPGSKPSDPWHDPWLSRRPESHYHRDPDNSRGIYHRRYVRRYRLMCATEDVEAVAGLFHLAPSGLFERLGIRLHREKEYHRLTGTQRFVFMLLWDALGGVDNVDAVKLVVNDPRIHTYRLWRILALLSVSDSDFEWAIRHRKPRC